MPLAPAPLLRLLQEAAEQHLGADLDAMGVADGVFA
jgi:hypothetical protein